MKKMIGLIAVLSCVIAGTAQSPNVSKGYVYLIAEKYGMPLEDKDIQGSGVWKSTQPPVKITSLTQSIISDTLNITAVFNQKLPVAYDAVVLISYIDRFGVPQTYYADIHADAGRLTATGATVVASQYVQGCTGFKMTLTDLHVSNNK
jgi:hypothetical protein